MKIPKGRKLIVIVFAACMLLLLIIGLTSNNRKTCEQLIQQTKTELIDKGTRAEAAKKFRDAEKQPLPSSCKVSNNKNATQDDLATKFNYYHQQAQIAFNLGEYQSAKKYADEGLKVNQLLNSTKIKEIKDHSAMVQDLKDAQVDPYAK